MPPGASLRNWAAACSHNFSQRSRFCWRPPYLAFDSFPFDERLRAALLAFVRVDRHPHRQRSVAASRGCCSESWPGWGWKISTACWCLDFALVGGPAAYRDRRGCSVRLGFGSARRSHWRFFYRICCGKRATDGRRSKWFATRSSSRTRRSRPLQFLFEQVLFLQPLALPVWLAGLWLVFCGAGREALSLSRLGLPFRAGDFHRAAAVNPITRCQFTQC